MDFLIIGIMILLGVELEKIGIAVTVIGSIKCLVIICKSVRDAWTKNFRKTRL